MKKKHKPSQFSRRDFFKITSMATTGGMLLKTLPIESVAHSSGSDQLKSALASIGEKETEAASLYTQTVDPKAVLGDTRMPPPDHVSQKFPYGISGKTPPSLIKINYEGQRRAHKHRINLRVFQGCPQVEISEGGRLWATWFGSNIQAERAPFHWHQFSVIATSADGGKTWKEVFVFDQSELLGAGASDPLLWKDPKGNIRFISTRNMDFRGMEDEFATSAWEFTMLDPEKEHTPWSEPRLLGNKNISVMKPLIFPDGTIMRSIDDFKLVGTDKVRIRFLKEDVDGKPIFVSELPGDPEARFAEQMPIIRKDGSLLTFYRTTKWQKFAESFDGGKTWKPGGFYHMQFSIDTKCILKRLPSGRVLLVANDVQMKEQNGETIFYYTDKDGNQIVLEAQFARQRMSAYLSDDDARTFPHKLLLCDKGRISYPSSTLDKDGSIYIAYDQGRSVPGQQTIFLSKITEQDILAGKLVNDKSFLNSIVSRPSDHGGGRRDGDSIH